MKYIGKYMHVKDKLVTDETYLVYGRYDRGSGRSIRYIGFGVHCDPREFPKCYREQFAFRRDEDFEMCHRIEGVDVDDNEGDEDGIFEYNPVDEIWLLTQKEASVMLMIEGYLDELE